MLMTVPLCLARKSQQPMSLSREVLGSAFSRSYWRSANPAQYLYRQKPLGKEALKCFQMFPFQWFIKEKDDLFSIYFKLTSTLLMGCNYILIACVPC